MAREALNDDFRFEITLAMVETGLRRKELSEMLGISPALLSAWITGTVRMSIGLARQMLEPFRDRLPKEQLGRLAVSALARIVTQERVGLACRIDAGGALLLLGLSGSGK